MNETTGHDMSHYWRLVVSDKGLVTGTWWVTRPDEWDGGQNVKPIDVTVWSEERHSGVVLHSEDFTAFVHGDEVAPISVRSRHAHVEAEANARLDEITAAVLAVAAAPEWPGEPAPDRTPTQGDRP